MSYIWIPPGIFQVEVSFLIYAGLVCTSFRYSRDSRMRRDTTCCPTAAGAHCQCPNPPWRSPPRCRRAALLRSSGPCRPRGCSTRVRAGPRGSTTVTTCVQSHEHKDRETVMDTMRAAAPSTCPCAGCTRARSHPSPPAPGRAPAVLTRTASR